MIRFMRARILLFTLVRTVLNTQYRMIYPFLPAFGRGLGVDLTTLAGALTVRSVAGALGPFLASVADTRGRKTGMLLGLLLFNLALAVVLVWPTYPGFFISLALAALGKTVFDPVMHAYLGDRVPYHRRGWAIGLVEIGWSLSFILGVPLMGFLIARRGWVSPFAVLIVLGAISTVVLTLALQGEREAVIGGNLRHKFRSLVLYPPAVAGIVMAMLSSASNEIVNVVFGVWLEETHQLEIAALGTASVVIGLAELAGEGLVSGLTDRLGKPRAIAAGLLLNSAAVLALPWFGATPSGAFVGLFLFYLTFEFTLVSIIPLITEILPEARATLLAATAAALSLGRAIGATLAPRVFLGGLLASAFVVVALNLLALFALQRARVREGGDVPG